MSNAQQKTGLSEKEYLKKVLTPLYDSDEPREVIIDKGKKQVEELLEAEKKIKEEMDDLAKKYESQ